MQLIEIVKTNELLYILNGRLSAALNRHLNRKFRAAGLDITTEQWGVLVSLWNKDQQTQQSISEQTFKDKASITRLLDSLAKHGLIVRISDPADRRINIVHLTNKGKEMEEKAMELVKESFNQAIEGIDRTDLLFTRDILLKLLNNIIT
ncbi:MAG: MarR family transcriptional regulator [Bacteroidales bacterium]|jgi:DNA-binding MarR family transcriptional regulator